MQGDYIVLIVEYESKSELTENRMWERYLNIYNQF